MFVRDVYIFLFFFFQAEDGIRDADVTGVQTCALPISPWVNAVTPLTNAFSSLGVKSPAFGVWGAPGAPESVAASTPWSGEKRRAFRRSPFSNRPRFRVR